MANITLYPPTTPNACLQAAAGLAVLADPTRRAIYESLDAEPRAVGEIARGFPVSRPAVSQHLRLLKNARLVTETRAGTRHLYAIDGSSALELRNYFQSMWERALARYASHVTTEEERRGRTPR